MREHTAISHTTHLEQLNQAPHVLTQLIDLLRGTLQCTPAQRQRIEQHLVTCLHCQAFVELSLLMMIKDAQAHGTPTEPARQLLTRWSRITHVTYKEEIPAYVETLMAQGEQKADTRFPWLAEHMHGCWDCQQEVRGLHSWLSQLA